MDYKQFKDISLSRLGYGCMRFPKIEGSETAIDETKAEKLIDKAYKSGINYFDVAYNYHGRTAEKFVGRMLEKYPRDSFYLATKLPFFSRLSASECKALFEEQRSHLRPEHIEFYLNHAQNRVHIECMKAVGLYDYLQTEKSNGRIRYLGFSFHDSPDVLEEIVNTYSFDFAQIQLNYVDWVLQNAEKEYEILSSRNIPIMVMEPVRGGALANLPEAAEEVLKAVRPEASAASWALRYVASLPAVQTVLSGMSSEAQLDDNLKTFSGMQTLSEAEEKAIIKARDIFISTNTIKCTACNYCQPCTVGIKIPKLFSAWNDYVLTRDKQAFIASYKAMEVPGSACVSSKQCVSLCPQKLDKVKHVKDVARSAACMSV